MAIVPWRPRTRPAGDAPESRRRSCAEYVVLNAVTLEVIDWGWEGESLQCPREGCACSCSGCRAAHGGRSGSERPHA